MHVLAQVIVIIFALLTFLGSFVSLHEVAEKKERKPITPGAFMFSMIINAVILILLFTAYF